MSRQSLACPCDETTLERMHVTFIRHKACRSFAGEGKSSSCLHLACCHCEQLRFKVSENEGWTNSTLFCSSSGKILILIFLKIYRHLTAGPFIRDINELCIHQLPAQSKCRKRNRACLICVIPHGNTFDLTFCSSAAAKPAHCMYIVSRSVLCKIFNISDFAQCRVQSRVC